MLRIVIALVLLAHGIGHSMGPLGLFKVAEINPAWRGDSWLLTGPAGTTLTNVVGVALWAVALLGFALVAAVVIGWLPEEWWRPLAIVSSVASIAGILLFPAAFPVFSNLGAIVVDVAVLVAVFWLSWTPSDLTA